MPANGATGVSDIDGVPRGSGLRARQFHATKPTFLILPFSFILRALRPPSSSGRGRSLYVLISDFFLPPSSFLICSFRPPSSPGRGRSLYVLNFFARLHFH